MDDGNREFLALVGCGAILGAAVFLAGLMLDAWRFILPTLG